MSKLVPNEPYEDLDDALPVDIYELLEEGDTAPYFDEDGEVIFDPYGELGYDRFDEFDEDDWDDE